MQRCSAAVLLHKQMAFVLTAAFSLFLSLSLIDRRGFVQSDAPQLAPPTNGITMYGATQSQQSHMVRVRLWLEDANTLVSVFDLNTLITLV